MSDQREPEKDYSYYHHTIERAEQAFLQRNWLLCATLCRLLEELEIDRQAREAWNGPTVSVPLLKVPMRNEQPTDCSARQHPFTLET